MADLGTMGDALAPDTRTRLVQRAATETPAPPEQADTDPTTNDALAGAIGRHHDATQAQLDRLASIDRRSDALRPPEMVEPPKMQEVHETPIGERWGSLAMLAASLGGLFTREPLVASLNAMADVNHAFNENDAARAKQAFDIWKVQSENAIRANDFRQRSYDEAVRKLSSDRQGAIGMIRATAAAFKDDLYMSLLDAGRTDDVLRMIGGGRAASSKLAEAQEKTAAQHELLLAWNDAHPDATPQQKAQARIDIMANRDPDAPRGGAAGAAERDVDTVANAQIAREEQANGGPIGEERKAQIRMDARNANKDAGRAPSATRTNLETDEQRAQIAFQQKYDHPYDSKTATQQESTDFLVMRDQAAAERKKLQTPDKPLPPNAQILADFKHDLREQHPDWKESQLDAEANRLIAESKNLVMNDEAADLNARVALQTGHAPTTMGRSQANIAKFQDAYARVAKEQGLTAGDIAGNQARFASEMSEARTLGTTSARIDFAARELDVALPQARELSERVWRPGFKPLASIQQALQGYSNDPDLLEFAQQNQAVMNAYAQAMQRGGVSTVSGMERAERLLSTATSQIGYIRQLDRLHQEVQAILYGTAAAKQALRNEITGRTTEVPPPTLTGVPRAGQTATSPSPSASTSGGPKEGDTAPSKSGKPMVFRGGQWQYQ
jgi:hypothetical protein